MVIAENGPSETHISLPHISLHHTAATSHVALGIVSTRHTNIYPATGMHLTETYRTLRFVDVPCELQWNKGDRSVVVVLSRETKESAQVPMELWRRKKALGNTSAGDKGARGSVFSRRLQDERSSVANASGTKEGVRKPMSYHAGGRPTAKPRVGTKALGAIVVGRRLFARNAPASERGRTKAFGEIYQHSGRCVKAGEKAFGRRRRGLL